MKRHVEPWLVGSVQFRKGNIDPNPPYQRGPVWNDVQKQLLIDSIFRGYDIPQLYLTKAQDPAYEWEVVDGQQRLRAIWGFFDDEYRLAEDADMFGEHEIANSSFGQLHPALKDRLQSYALSIVLLEEEKAGEIEEMFLRLQNGASLNSAEKRNAISGALRDFIHETAQEHRLFSEHVSVVNNRYAHDELAAQMLLLEQKGEPTAITHTRLKPMYENGRRYNKNCSEARRFRRVLNFLVQAFPEKSPHLTKVNLISLYTVASELLAKFAILSRANEFGRWFAEFEERRREDRPQEDSEMYDYTLAVLQRTGSVAAQKIRRETLLKSVLAALPDLKLLDDRRRFTHEQRLVIFSRADGFCVNPEDNPECSETCTWDNWHADHIIPHSKGGETTVNNGQLLCPSCNIKKSDKAA